jgi:ERCC4-type nuclease
MPNNTQKKKNSLPSSKPTIAYDSREQKPYKFRAGKNCAGMVKRTLDHGDYQVDGMPNLITIERKQNIDELCNNIGKNRDRFERELVRMQVCKHRYVVVEDYYSSISRPKFSKMHPNAIWGSVVSLEIKYGVKFMFCGNRKTACRIVKLLLTKAYEHEVENESV